MTFFLSQFVVISGTNQNCGWFDFVPELLREKSSPVSLDLALRSVALISIANRYRRHDLMVKALHLNGQALEAVNMALASPLEAIGDGLFAAILLLCLFGVSSFGMSMFNPANREAY